jgi:trimeric autotransporter adhesin
LGSDSVASGVSSTALGNTASASAVNATAIGGGATASAGNSSALGVYATASGTGASAIGGGASASGAGSVALGRNSTDGGRGGTVSIGSAGSERTISNMAAGLQGTDGANVTQVKAVAANLGMTQDVTGAFVAPTYNVNGKTYGTMATAVTGLGNDVGTVTSTLNGIAAGTVGLVRQPAGVSGAIGIGSATGGTSVNVGGIDGSRTIMGVKEAALTSTSTEAVTGSQLKTTNDAVRTVSTGLDATNTTVRAIGTNLDTASASLRAVGSNLGMSVDPNSGLLVSPSYTVNGRHYGTLVSAVSGLGGDVGALTTTITGLSGGTLGLVQQGTAASGAGITIGSLTGGTSVNVAGAAGSRTIDGVSAGAVNSSSSQAVNGSQLSATNGAVAAQGVQIGTLTNTVTNLSSTFATFQTMVQTGGTGMVQQTGGGNGTITVGGATGGTTVSMAGTAGNRTVAGVADGAVSATSTEAVNGRQLNSTNTRVAAVETTVGQQGTRITGVEATVQLQGTRISSVESSVVDQGRQLSSLGGQVQALNGRVDDLAKKTESNTKGIAAAMALPSVSIPAGKRFALGADLSTYSGHQAFGFGAGVSLDRTWSVQGSVAGSFDSGPAGGRIGLRAAW